MSPFGPFRKPPAEFQFNAGDNSLRLRHTRLGLSADRIHVIRSVDFPGSLTLQPADLSEIISEDPIPFLPAYTEKITLNDVGSD